jgi:hypothetical protein
MARMGRAGFVPLLVLALALPTAGSAEPAAVPALKVVRASVSASWDQGWFLPGAAIRFTGMVAAPATLTATLKPVGQPAIVSAYQAFQVAHGGDFNEKLALPARLQPGPYTLKIGGMSGTAKLKTVRVTVTIPAPPEGVLARALVGPTDNGPWLTYVGKQGPAIHGRHTLLWMRFRFLYPPAGQNVLVVWKLDWRRIIGKVYKRYKDTIDTMVQSAAPLPSGVWLVTLTIDGRIAKKMDVHLTG